MRLKNFAKAIISKAVKIKKPTIKTGIRKPAISIALRGKKRIKRY